MSAFGPRRTWPCALQESAFEGKTDMGGAVQMSALGQSGHPRGVELSTFNPVPSLTKACLKPPTTGIQIGRVPRRGTAMIRNTVFRALVLTAAFAAALTPVTCLGENSNRLPTKATKKLPPELLSLLRQKKMPIHSPILVRVFKEEAELEVWKQDTTDRFQILKSYPICRWSGDLGPKLQEGDRQTPEGFYRVTPELMNPHSNYYLAINIGYPNNFDKANNRDGSLLMIHSDCWSSGCYAMTDEQISEIYS